MGKPEDMFVLNVDQEVYDNLTKGNYAKIHVCCNGLVSIFYSTEEMSNISAELQKETYELKKLMEKFKEKERARTERLHKIFSYVPYYFVILSWLTYLVKHTR